MSNAPPHTHTNPGVTTSPCSFFCPEFPSPERRVLHNLECDFLNFLFCFCGPRPPCCSTPTKSEPTDASALWTGSIPYN